MDDQNYPNVSHGSPHIVKVPSRNFELEFEPNRNDSFQSKKVIQMNKIIR